MNIVFKWLLNVLIMWFCGFNLFGFHLNWNYLPFFDVTLYIRVFILDNTKMSKVYLLSLQVDNYADVIVVIIVFPTFKRGFITSKPLSKSILFVSAYCFLVKSTRFFNWGQYATFHGMALTCHIECSMITAVWTNLRMFLNSNFTIFMFKC
jgi:hypothetical protein